jgi:energy-converting hydrogenase Eha subunit A
MRKSRDVGGLAAIIDSLVFVCIISVIALLILESPSDEVQSKSWDQSSMFHSVLIHSTVSMMEIDVGGANYAEAQVSELLCEALGSGDRSLMNRLSDRLELISESLIETPYHYRWVISGTNDEIAIGEGAIPDSCDIMTSTIEVKRDQSAFASVLYLWIL